MLTSTAIATARPTLLDGNALSQEVQSISFRFSDVVSNRRTFLAAAWTLRRRGIICLREAAPADLIASINSDVVQMLAEIESGDHGRLASMAYPNLPDDRVPLIIVLNKMYEQPREKMMAVRANATRMRTALTIVHTPLTDVVKKGVKRATVVRR